MLSQNNNLFSNLIVDSSSPDININGHYRNSILNSNIIGKHYLYLYSYIFHILLSIIKGLSYYEVIAGPREIKDISNISFSDTQITTLIKDVFKCTICLSLFIDPVNIKNCLHKFCRKCIEDYNRKEKKECVICRKPIETRRHMVDDDNMKRISKYNDYTLY